MVIGGATVGAGAIAGVAVKATAGVAVGESVSLVMAPPKLHITTNTAVLAYRSHSDLSGTRFFAGSIDFSQAAFATNKCASASATPDLKSFVQLTAGRSTTKVQSHCFY
jgi:hypothetical protein